MRTPARNPTPRTGELRCGARTWASDPLCERPATWHIAFLLSPRGHFTLVCDDHMNGLGDFYDYVDRHPADVNCDMPGTGWLTGQQPSRCVIAPPTDTHPTQEQP